jgi:hypothetical protein
MLVFQSPETEKSVDPICAAFQRFLQTVNTGMRKLNREKTSGK